MLPNFFSFDVFQILIFNADDLSLIIRATSLADSVRHHQSAALAALYQVRSAHLPVSPAAVSSRFGRLILRTDRHGYTSFISLKIS